MTRARRSAARSRLAIGLTGLVIAVGWPGQHGHPAAAALGFAIILATATVQLTTLHAGWLGREEAVAALAAVLIVGLGDQHGTGLDVLWLSAAVSGVLARGGRAHWAGRALLVLALVLPMVLDGRVSSEHVALCVAALWVLLTSGRLTNELRDLLSRARFDADHDGLTGTLARESFRAALTARAQDGPLAVLAVDLDGFGYVNKAFGQAAGDRMLVTAVQRLEEVVGEDGLVGRLGGDEFAVVVAPERALAVSRELLARLGTASEPISASIGIARAPEHGRAADPLLRAGDVALRVAKRRGKHQVVRYDGLSLADDAAGGARGALLELIDGHGLEVIAQPIVDISNHVVHAYEALSRFGTPGTDGPMQWFALADELGLRAELELASLRAALPLLDSCPDGVRLSVNVSGGLLGDPRVLELLDGVEQLERLILEVTEDTLVDDLVLLGALRPLLERGMALAIDDVGAGYSGLRQLTGLRPSYLKLDRSLISGIEAAPERAALVEALVGYARRTGGRVVAEGVETHAELEAVTALGVDLVQGYLLGRPAGPWPSAALEQLPARCSATAALDGARRG